MPTRVLVPGLHHGGPHYTDPDTAAMLTEAAHLAGTTWHVYQGSYHDGAKSGGTHLSGGVVDIWPATGTPAAAVAALRTVGAAAWHRRPPLFTAHIHAVRVDCTDLSASARVQVQLYHDGLNGLWPPHRGRDDGPRDHANATWTTYRQEHPAMSLTPADLDAIARTVRANAGGASYGRTSLWTIWADTHSTVRALATQLDKLTAALAGATPDQIKAAAALPPSPLAEETVTP